MNQNNQIISKLQNYILADGMEIIFDFERSEGPYFYDSVSKKKYLDLFCFFATQAVGYNHPKLLEKSFLEKLQRVNRVKVTLSDVYCEEYSEFVETFVEKCTKKYFAHHFFIDGGSQAVENTLKAAFDWKIRLNQSKNRGEKGYEVIHFKEAFHGRGGYALSLTNTFDPKKHMYFAKFQWPRITNPKCFFPMDKENMEKTKKLEEMAIQEIQNVLKSKRDDICAVIIEPIQSEGGDNHFRKEFLMELRNICDQNELLLIFDEVQVGGGSSGKWWAFESLGVVPDGICFAKKFLTGGVAFTKRIDEVKDNVFQLSSRINSTFGGNIVDMVRAKQIIDIVEEEKLLDNAKIVGDYLKDKLLEIQSAHPNKISNTRGLGLIVAWDLPDTETRDAFMKKTREEGLLVMACGQRTIRVRPMLDLKKEHVDKAVSIIDKVL